MSKITARMLTLRDRTADVTIFLYVTSGGLQHFLCADFLHFIALNAIWPHFLGIKLCFYPIFMPSKHAEQDPIDAKWLGKKLVF